MRMMPFADYWPLYLRAHSRRATRRVHYVATIIGLSSSTIGVAILDVIVIGLGIGCSYGIAISSHWLIEGNRPMIAVNPVWGAVADLRMTWLAATGRLAPELVRHGVDAGT